MEVYRHYGHSHFDINQFNQVVNRPYSNKPFGGLWSSPTEDVDIGWKEWCVGNEFNLDKLDTYFDFRIKDNSKILEIKDIKDLDKLPKVRLDEEVKEIITSINIVGDIDFEELSKEYDGIQVWMYRSKDINSTERLFDGIYYRMYGWDVDTLLVLNPNIIEEI